MLSTSLRCFYSTKMHMRRRIKDLFNRNPDKTSALVQGWIRSIRKHKNKIFVDINDGSSLSSLQVVMKPEDFESGMSYGASLQVIGEIVQTKLNKTKFEMQCDEAKLVGECDETFPFMKHAGHDMQYFRMFPHLRMKDDHMAGVIRVRNSLEMQIHKYFQDKGFLHINGPVITSSDCEGAGEVFTVASNKMVNVDTDSDHDDVIHRQTCDQVEMSKVTDQSRSQSLVSPCSNDVEQLGFFGKPAFLTVSSQLHLEACAMGVGDVYTLNPAFRAENNNTKKHLSEFRMLEVEVAFIEELEAIMDLMETSTKTILEQTYSECLDDITMFTNDLPAFHKNVIEDVAYKSYTRIPYKDAIEILQNNKDLLKTPPPMWGDDINNEHESFLTKHFGFLPVFITNFPVEMKPFYAYNNQDGTTVAAVDLIFPFCGELSGGSVREHRFELLRNKLNTLNLSETYEWYLDLRRYGNAPHAGYGLGFDRLVRFILGINNIRDAVMFPRSARSCLL